MSRNKKIEQFTSRSGRSFKYTPRIEFLEQRKMMSANPLSLGFCPAFALDSAFIAESAFEGPQESIVGDVNSDGRFDQRDLDQVLQTGKFEDGISNNASRIEGDLNGDGDFDSADLVFAFQRGSFTPLLQNAKNPADVNNDGVVSAIDTLMIVNELNLHDVDQVAVEDVVNQSAFLDADGNGLVNKIDLDLVVGSVREQ